MNCECKERCERDLAYASAGTVTPDWENYCPNATTLKAMSAGCSQHPRLDAASDGRRNTYFESTRKGCWRAVRPPWHVRAQPAARFNPLVIGPIVGDDQSLDRKEAPTIDQHLRRISVGQTRFGGFSPSTERIAHVQCRNCRPAAPRKRPNRIAEGQHMPCRCRVAPSSCRHLPWSFVPICSKSTS